ncbi:MAG: FAD-dependent oxidoreductase, partial [Ilumatobacteraceae bacterium]
MTPRRRRVAILGGGMAGVATAWRLSEAGWENELESITLYQRGWRLGGKGASSRGVHGRIEEHGLHIWLGYYENAFRLLRECYAELDRPRTDPVAPIRMWREALIPAPVVGLEELRGDTWTPWVGRFAANDELPGEAEASGGVMTVAEFVTRAIRLLGDFVGSLQFDRSCTGREVTLTGSPVAPGRQRSAASLATIATDPRMRRSWHLVSVVLATMRGIVADGLLTDPRGFRKINDEDYRAWIRRHGASAEAVDSTLVRGLYDLVFAHIDGDPHRSSFGAGWGVFLSGKTFFDYKGSIFWKMTAGMGDVVFAPLYEALRRRGVEFEFFHRVDELHVAADCARIGAVTLGVQAQLAPGYERYEPLVRVKGLPCFPDAPLGDQLVLPDSVDGRSFESHSALRHDVGQRVLRAGDDFDALVFAIPVGMAKVVCSELIADQPAWRDMVDNVRTVATQAVQLWLREDEPTLGWDRPGVTMTGFVKPLDTWASMPQVIDAEDWPADEQPRTIAYFCGTM